MGQKPKFEPQVPPLILALTKPLSIERHLLEQSSINDQKNDLILERLTEGDNKFESQAKLIEEVREKSEKDRRELSLDIKSVSDRVKPFEKWADRFTGGKIVVSLLLMGLGTLLSIILAAWLEGWFAHMFAAHK